MSELSAHRLRTQGLESADPPEGATCGGCAEFDEPPRWMVGAGIGCGACDALSARSRTVRRCNALGDPLPPEREAWVECEWVLASDPACEDWRPR